MDSVARQAMEIAGRLFEPLGDVVFCAKDRDGRYLAVNRAFAERLSLSSERDILGRTAKDLFPRGLAEGYVMQDREVLGKGQAIGDRLERITNRDGSVGWFLTSKYPLKDAAGQTVGLLAVSQDLHTPSSDDVKIARLAEVVAHIQSHLDDLLRVDELARLAGMTVTQLDRRMKKVFRISVKQFVIKCRIENATRLLAETTQPLGEIALACGFSDQSAFTRQFKATTGLPPGEFRKSGPPA